MQPIFITETARTLACGFRGDIPILCREMVQRLALGQPVALTELAASLNLSVDEVTAAVRRMPDVELDEVGNVVGSGLTLIPTQHSITLGDRALYTWCALDALTYPALLQETARVSSPCAATGTPIRFTVTPEGITDLEPSTAVISLVIPDPSQPKSCNRANFCDHVDFYISNEAAATWLQGHPGAAIVPLQEAHTLAENLARYQYQEGT